MFKSHRPFLTAIDIPYTSLLTIYLVANVTTLPYAFSLKSIFDLRSHMTGSGLHGLHMYTIHYIQFSPNSIKSNNCLIFTRFFFLFTCIAIIELKRNYNLEIVRVRVQMDLEEEKKRLINFDVLWIERCFIINYWHNAKLAWEEGG